MEKQAIWRGSAKAYALAFLLSLVLTLAAYFLATEKILSGWMLSGSIALLGLIQAWAQLFVFLNVGRKTQARLEPHRVPLRRHGDPYFSVPLPWIMNYLNYNLM